MNHSLESAILLSEVNFAFPRDQIAVVGWALVCGYFEVIQVTKRRNEIVAIEANKGEIDEGWEE